MIVMPEFSRLTGFTPGDNQPIIDRRTASTTLNVANRQTVVIGGLRQRGDVGDFKGIPYLKDMKYLGHLFRYRKTDVEERELVVFITPEIIAPDDQPNRREQLVVDTTHFRLDQIPEAEGCPPCCPEDCDCEPTESTPTTAATIVPDPSILPIAEEDVPATPNARPSEARRPVPRNEQPADALAPDIRFGITTNNPQVRDLAAQGSWRRLPAVDGGQIATAPVTPPANSPQLFQAPPAVASRVGPDYDSRARATSPYLQNTTEEGATPEAEKKEGFWNGIMRF
jgi:general secretion pathway protein D